VLCPWTSCGGVPSKLALDPPMMQGGHNYELLAAYRTFSFLVEAYTIGSGKDFAVG